MTNENGSEIYARYRLGRTKHRKIVLAEYLHVQTLQNVLITLRNC